MNAKQYTELQVLHGLLEAWPNFTAVDDPFDADTRIDAYLKENGCWDELDFADVFRGIERFFGFKCPHKEWTDFFGIDIASRSVAEWEAVVGPTLTFGSLARFIAARVTPLASFDPISIFGRECSPAGAFIGIQQVVNKVTKSRLQFGPSTRISEILRGRNLHAFWTQMLWMTKHSLPQLPTIWRNVTELTGCLGVLAVVGASIVAWKMSNPAWTITTLLGALFLDCMAWTYKQFTNPLPTQIVTFRDLSMFVANNRNRAAVV